MSAAPFAAPSAPRMRGSGVVKGLKPSGSGGLPMPPDARLLLPPLLGPSGGCVRDDGGLDPQIVLRGTACASPPAMRTGATFILLMSAAIVCAASTCVHAPSCKSRMRRAAGIATQRNDATTRNTRAHLRQEPLLRPHGVDHFIDGHLAAVPCQVV